MRSSIRIQFVHSASVLASHFSAEPKKKKTKSKKAHHFIYIDQ